MAAAPMGMPGWPGIRLLDAIGGQYSNCIDAQIFQLLSLLIGRHFLQGSRIG